MTDFFKTGFKAEDFIAFPNTDREAKIAEDVVQIANEILFREVEGAALVFCNFDHRIWSGIKAKKFDTHTARLICVEPVGNEGERK